MICECLPVDNSLQKSECLMKKKKKHSRNANKKTNKDNKKKQNKSKSEKKVTKLPNKNELALSTAKQQNSFKSKLPKSERLTRLTTRLNNVF